MSATPATTRGRWDESRIRAELEPFLAGRDTWPSYREFQHAGLRPLRDHVTASGGVQRWAAELGKRTIRHPPGYPTIWTENRIRDHLARYLSGHKTWPSRSQFEHDGHTALRNAINRTGGPDRWAAEFQLPRPNRRSGIKRGWTPPIIEAELTRLIGRGSHWPSTQDFKAAGLASMLSAIYAHEGVAYWAKRIGVHHRDRHGHQRRAVWTVDRISTELEQFCSGRRDWPTEREFRAAGQESLYRAASRNGGVAAWALQLSLERRRRPASI